MIGLFYLLLRIMRISLALFLIITLLACNSNSAPKKAENAEEAGTEFIRASLKGDYDRAKFYLLKDSINLFYLDRWKNNVYDKLTSEEKNGYENASIRPVKIQPVNDSVTDYVYTNSYKGKDTVTFKVVRVGGATGEWLVDIKEYFQGTK